MSDARAELSRAATPWTQAQRVFSVLNGGHAAAQVYTIETIAGGGDGIGDDGPAISAKLAEPTGVAVDAAGNIYIADTFNNRIRRVDASGIIEALLQKSDSIPNALPPDRLGDGQKRLHLPI